jgi:hypothetical protein
MESVTQIEEHVRRILGPRADELAKETGFVQREREVRGSTFVQGLTFGWLHEPESRMEQLAQALARAGSPITASGLSQRFNEKAVRLVEKVFEELVQETVRVEAAELSLLKRFRAVIVEDSSQIHLPQELRSRWKGCGNGSQRQQAGIKLHVQWDLVSGEVRGPVLTEGKHADQRSPLRHDPDLIPEGGVYLADNGYFGLEWLQAHASEGRYALMRPRANTAFFDLSGKRLDLLSIGPKEVGATLDRSVKIGGKVRWQGRLIMIRVPEEVAELRRERIKRTAQRHSREADPQHLAQASWTILITNVPMELLSTVEVVIMQRARWQIERLFRLWKEEGLLDEWRSKKPDRILCEIYGKLMGLLIQHWLLQQTCWSDPMRSLVKAGRVIRDQAWDLLRVIQGAWSLAVVIQHLRCIMSKTCHLDRRQKAPCTAQLLAGILSDS